MAKVNRSVKYRSNSEWLEAQYKHLIDTDSTGIISQETRDMVEKNLKKMKAKERKQKNLKPKP